MCSIHLQLFISNLKIAVKVLLKHEQTILCKKFVMAPIKYGGP